MPLMFADPKYDVSFKRLFGEKQNVKLTINFLNEVLNRQEGHKIKEIIFMGTEKTPRFKKEVKTYIDIQCKDQSDHEFIIEMQSAKEDFFAKRVQYYVAHAVSRQLEKGAYYPDLKPVIFVGVLDFHLFEKSKNKDIGESSVVTHHVITNQDTHEQTLKLMEFHFVELPKFKKTEAELKTQMDRWLYFLRKAPKLDKIPKACAQSEEVKEAFHVMERSTWERKDWDAYEEERKLQIYYATQEYAQQLRNQKYEEQDRKLEEKTKKLEEQTKKLEVVALSLLKKKIEITEIVDLTGLSIEQIEKLRK